MGCTQSHASFVEEPDSVQLNAFPESGYATVIAGTRRAGVCWCGNFCREMLDQEGNPCRQRCCLHSVRPWTRQCDACRFRQKEARVQKVRCQQDAMQRQIHVSNGIYLHKKACCGMPCQILSCRQCCRHVKPPCQPQNYCCICQERASPRSRSPTSMMKNVEGGPRDCKVEESKKRPVQEEDLFPTVVEEECPICLEHLPIDELCRLPCGHLVCHGHIDKLERCPLCRQSVPGSAVMLMAISAWRKRHGTGLTMRNEPIE